MKRTVHASGVFDTAGTNEGYANTTLIASA